MARLPGAEQLGQRAFQDRSRLVDARMDTSGQEALIGAVSSFAQNQAARMDRTSLHKAKMHFQKKKLEADHAFDRDQDFETYQERYDEKLNQARQEAAKMVRNPNDRAMFEEEMDLYHARGTQGIIAKSWNKEVDKSLADLDEIITIGRENFLRGGDSNERMFAIDTVNKAIDSMQEATYLDADKARDLRKKVAVDFATAAIEIEEPQKQIEMLKAKGGVADLIPTDQRKDMLRKAENSRDADEALRIANQIRIEGGDREERLEKLHKIKDPQVKKDATAQVNAQLKQEQMILAKDQYDIYQDLGKDILKDPAALNRFKKNSPKEWDTLTFEQQKSLEKQVAGGATAVKTDPFVYREFLRKSNESTKEAEEFFYKNFHKFSSGKQLSIIEDFAKAEGEPSPLFNIQYRLDTKMEGLNLSSADKEDAMQRVDEAYRAWASSPNNRGKKMSIEDQDAILKTVFDETTVRRWHLMSKKRSFEIELDQANLDVFTRHKDKIEKDLGRALSDQEAKSLEMFMRNEGMFVAPAGGE